MKKIIGALAIMLICAPSLTFAQTVDRVAIQDQINALIAIVTQLQQMLYAMQNASEATSTVAVGAGLGTDVVQTTPSSTPLAVQTAESSTPILTVPVTFTSSGTFGYVTIENTLGETIRVKSMIVDGAANHVSFNDSPNWNFQPHFDCRGLGSLGYKSVYGDSHMDVCARRDNGQPVNEIAPGEKMVIEYSGNPTGVSTGTIETVSGESVTF